LELDGADEHRGVEPALRIPRDVLHALGELRAEALAAKRVPGDGALAPEDELVHEGALEIDLLGRVGVAARLEPLADRLDGLALGGSAQRAGLEEVRVIPAALPPRRAQPAVDGDARGPQQLVEAHLLDAGVPGRPGRDRARAEDLLGQRPPGAELERR